MASVKWNNYPESRPPDADYPVAYWVIIESVYEWEKTSVAIGLFQDVDIVGEDWWIHIEGYTIRTNNITAWAEIEYPQPPTNHL